MNWLHKRQEQKGIRISLFSFGALRNNFNLVILCWFFSDDSREIYKKKCRVPSHLHRELCNVRESWLRKRGRVCFFKSESCQVPSEIYGITNECYGEYYITGDDKNDYTPGWNITTYATKISWDDMPWRYQDRTQLDGYPFWAKLTTYGGVG